jgi:hypothetical protein
MTTIAVFREFGMAAGHTTAMVRLIFDVNWRTEPFESAILSRRCGSVTMVGILVRIDLFGMLAHHAKGYGRAEK